MISHTINQKSEEELESWWIALCKKDCAPAEKP